MKICIYCDKVLEDDCKECPYCDKTVHDKNCA